MKKTLGIDLRTNSIGWAIIEQGNGLTKYGVHSIIDKSRIIKSKKMFFLF